MLLWVGGVFRIWSRPLLQGSGLLSVDKRDSEPGPAVCIGALKVRRSGHHCASGWLANEHDVISGKRATLDAKHELHGPKGSESDTQIAPTSPAQGLQDRPN